MSSFSEHPSEQTYDNPSATLPTTSERTPLITKTPSGVHPLPGTSYTTNDSCVNFAIVRSSLPGSPPSIIVAGETDALLEPGVVGCQQQQHPGDNVSTLSTRELAAREFKILLRYSGPVVLTYTLQNSLQLASLVSLGHLGSTGKGIFVVNVGFFLFF